MALVWSHIQDNVGYGLTADEVAFMESDVASVWREQQLRGALSKLPANATEEDVIRTIRPYASGSDLLKYQTSTMDRRAAREQAANQFKDTLQQKYDLAQQRSEDTRATEQDRIAARRELAQIAAAMRQPPAPTMTEVMDPTDPKRMLRVDAKTYRGGSLGSPGVLGVSGKEPTAAKKEETAATGKDNVSAQVTQLRDYYNQLSEAGGITDPEQGTSANVMAGIASSGPGQFVGRVVGTKNQSIRNSIAQQRPLLLNAIRQATGMSAKQMDSNAELKLYLAAATDPTLDIKANLAALANIDRLYGTALGTKGGGGGGGAPIPDAPPPGAVRRKQ